MKWIVITRPDFFAGEAACIGRLFDAGIDFLHLRKPGSTAQQCAGLLGSIDPQWYGRIIMHDHFELCGEYGLGGIHLNSRHPDAPDGFGGHVSCSCHSLGEVASRKPSSHYVFLSPIFDSISKSGYASRFTPAMLDEAASQGLIDSRVVALGGISPACLPALSRWHFGGAAFLGAVWQQMDAPDEASWLRQLEQAIHAL